MRIERLTIEAGNATIGMYVSKLDRPWLETPFLYQGFIISSEEEIDQLTESQRFASIRSRVGRDRAAHRRQVHNHHRRRHQPLVSRELDVPRGHSRPDVLRLRWHERGRAGTLRRANF